MEGDDGYSENFSPKCQFTPLSVQHHASGKQIITQFADPRDFRMHDAGHELLVKVPPSDNAATYTGFLTVF